MTEGEAKGVAISAIANEIARAKQERDEEWLSDLREALAILDDKWRPK